jgi:hypothetical protein
MRTRRRVQTFVTSWMAKRGDSMRFLLLVSALLCLLGSLALSCQFPPPTSTPPPTPTATATPTPTPTPTPRPLTEAGAIALIKEELAARGVALGTARVTVKGEPRGVSVRYTTVYDLDSDVFTAQTILVALAISRAVLRVEPPIKGGINLAILPSEEGEVGLWVITIGGPALERWANGSLSDQQFVGEWTVGNVTTE